MSDKEKPKHVEDLNEPPSSQWASSALKIALGSPIFGVVSTIVGYGLCDRFLAAGASTEQLKLMIAASLLGSAAIGSAGGVVGLIQRSLKLTDAKIKMQTPAELPDSIQAGVVNMQPTESTPAERAPVQTTALPSPPPLDDLGEDTSHEITALAAG